MQDMQNKKKIKCVKGESKTPFLTFVYISKCNINLPGYLGNSKKRFLWTSLVHMLSWCWFYGAQRPYPNVRMMDGFWYCPNLHDDRLFTWQCYSFWNSTSEVGKGLWRMPCRNRKMVVVVEMGDWSWHWWWGLWELRDNGPLGSAVQHSTKS